MAMGQSQVAIIYHVMVATVVVTVAAMAIIITHQCIHNIRRVYQYQYA